MAPLWEKIWSYIPHYTQIFPKSKPYVFPNFGETQGEDKTTNWCLSLRSKIPVIARPVRTLVVAIPPLEGKCTENYPEEWELLRFLVVIVTWFLSTGGLPRQFANWLAMTALIRQTSISRFDGLLVKEARTAALPAQSPGGGRSRSRWPCRRCRTWDYSRRG